MLKVRERDALQKCEVVVAVVQALDAMYCIAIILQLLVLQVDF